MQGGFVIRETTGTAESGTYLMAPRYQVVATISGRFAWGLDVGVNYLGRQGYAAPYFRGRLPGSVDATNETGKNVLVVPDVDKFRLPIVHALDLRASRDVTGGCGKVEGFMSALGHSPQAREERVAEASLFEKCALQEWDGIGRRHRGQEYGASAAARQGRRHPGPNPQSAVENHRVFALVAPSRATRRQTFDNTRPGWLGVKQIPF